jgi:hypothetical protein
MPISGIPGRFGESGTRGDFEKDEHPKYDKIRRCNVCRNPMGKTKKGGSFMGRTESKRYYIPNQKQMSPLKAREKDYKVFGHEAFMDSDNVCHACKGSKIIQMSNYETSGKAWDWDFQGIGDGDEAEGQDFIDRVFGI